MGALYSMCFGKRENLIFSTGDRISNAIYQHAGGLFGFIIPLIALPIMGSGAKNKPEIIVQCMWIWMAWSFLFHPVAVPMVGLIPIFILPTTGIMSSAETCSCYMNDSMVLLILSSMILLCLNNSGLDRRIALWFMCLGDKYAYTGPKLVLKGAVAGFFLSMFSNRLIVCSTLIKYVNPIMTNMQSATSRNRAVEPDYYKMNNIIVHSIHTSCSLGSVAILHSSVATLALKAMFDASAASSMVYPDLFNYMQYSIFAFPVALLMMIVNLIYHLILINNCNANRTISSRNLDRMKEYFGKYKKDIPKALSSHEVWSFLFHFGYLIVVFTRWNRILNKGWGQINMDSNTPIAPTVKDATPAAIFAISAFIFPKGFSFLKFLTKKKKSQLQPIKPESAILWWRFVDKNINYGYFYLIGSGVALVRSVQKSGLSNILSDHFGSNITGMTWWKSLLVVCGLGTLCSNIMSGVSGLVVILPFVLGMSEKVTEAARSSEDIEQEYEEKDRRANDDDSSYDDHEGYLRAFAPLSAAGRKTWHDRRYLGALGVGMAASLGFIYPFPYSTAYFAFNEGKVPKFRLFKLGLISAVLCMCVTFVALFTWGPFLFHPDDLIQVPAPVEPGAPTTTPAADAPA